ncbi:L-aspartate oxidase [Natronomonas marina]|jgi:L-aspartate oxidase|uniref:L-aspartate oxidase n=1 Tax=Natronomonas marina TaxID=2961939 RepID=UPI0020C95A75|nr:FAD-dependent oxidoreductase [Natronomonas marina]
MGDSETPRVPETRAGSEATRERTTDLLVVGSGIAGCAAALAGARAGADVTLATKAARPEESTSYWAQGGVAVARGDPEALKADILEAGDGLSDPEAVDVLVSEADDAVRDVFVETLDVEFDGGESPDYGREAAHSEARILHVDASTGRHLLAPFLNHLADHDRIEVLEDTAALELLTHEGRVHGALLERDGEWAPCFAGATVLATGGIGSCYRRSTNPRTATGDGIAMAALAGADVADMEYVQFHPTAFAPGDAAATGGEDGRGTFLLSEAVRGEGALLRNGDVSASDASGGSGERRSPGGERFMPDYHEDAELAPRDVVARAVKRERERTGEVRLDVSPLDFADEFPGLAAECERRGVDPADGIPVAPAEHFLCGGIDVDTEGRASLDRLFAVGECARTGVHGANRLASTSLLESLVWGLRAGEAAAGFEAERVEAPEMLDSDPDMPEGFADEKFVRLRRVMDEYVGITRTPEDLNRAAGVLRRLKGEVDAYTRTRTSRSLYELRGACVTALLVARAAAENDRSRGCHHIAEGAAVDAD